MKLGCNQPIGPLALADMIGLDVCLAVMDVYLTEFGDSKYRPCPLLKENGGRRPPGRKTGRGVYSLLLRRFAFPPGTPQRGRLRGGTGKGRAGFAGA